MEMTDIQKKKFERLEGFKSLKEGWDGFYACTVDKNIINFLQKVILAMTDDDLLKWNIFPTLDGGIMLSRRFGQNGQLYFSTDNSCTACSLSDNGKDFITLKFQTTDSNDEVLYIINKIDEFFKENDSKIELTEKLQTVA